MEQADARKKTDHPAREQGGTAAAVPAGRRQRLPWRTAAAVGVGRCLHRLLRRAGRAATTLPGRVALLLDPRLLSRLAGHYRIILITGTNGKTTCARMLTGIMRGVARAVVSNDGGANLDTGLATTLLCQLARPRRRRAAAAPATGAPRPDAVLEVDEAAFAVSAGALAPAVCVVTNIFRDQLDRYGSPEATRALLAQGLAAAAQARGAQGCVWVLCADDPLCAQLADAAPAYPTVQLMWSGMARADMQAPGRADAPQIEAAACPDCHLPYHYRARSYAHLGDYACPRCGRQRPAARVAFRLPRDPQPGAFVYCLPDAPAQQISTPLATPGVHNQYNAAAAVAAAVATGIPFEQACAHVGTVTAAAGRMERLSLAGRAAWMILVKNAAGMERALEHVAAAPDAGALFLLLNSAAADGQDTGWIWDVHWEGRALPTPLFVAGRRVWDLAVRLRYAGWTEAQIRADTDAARMLAAALAACAPGQALYILPNYSAMLELRAGALAAYDVRAGGKGCAL